jgi:rhamnogalacturonyl hydrolase YesR
MRAGSPPIESSQRAVETAAKLLAWCEAKDWAGYDPYDALNSRIFQALPFLNLKLVRLAATQAIKRCPINARPLLLVPETHNPKGLALFLKAFLSLDRCGLLERAGLVSSIVDKIEELRSPDARYWAWGYSFPWQGRKVLVPRGAPNLICTTFVADALLDLYETRGEARFLNMATSAADYLLNELYWTEGNSVAGFSYPLPSSRSQVHNANFLGAAFLCRVGKHSGERKYHEAALKAARCSAGRQRADGSWLYGELATQGWIDNFHTGYNLCGLRAIGQATGTDEFEKCVERGFSFYRRHFFENNGAPKYFHDRAYPFDIHSVAQSIITLLTLKDLDPENVRLAHSVLEWTMANLWDERGFFYHQKSQRITVKIPYMRWGQAWMLLALAALIEDGAEIEASPARGVQRLEAVAP